MEKEKNKTASWLKGHVYDVAAYAGLVITIILFLIFSGDKLMYNATTVLQTVAPYAIISLGAVFTPWDLWTSALVSRLVYMRFCTY